MFEKNKGRYLTKGINENVCIELQMFLWEAVDKMPEPKDWLQVFNLNIENGMQVIRHTSEQLKFEMTYIIPMIAEPITEKIYIIDDGEHCTMLFASEY
ncbi:MAG: DUF960 family protein [Oscillospiraceae bacterium]